MTGNHNKTDTNYGFQFRDWDIYKDARNFRKNIYQHTKAFPPEEKFSLSNQTKRAANSIVLNIAESANRQTDKDTKYFINIAHTSLDETIACMDCAIDSGYINHETHKKILRDASSLAKRCRAFVNHLS